MKEICLLIYSVVCCNCSKVPSYILVVLAVYVCIVIVCSGSIT